MSDKIKYPVVIITLILITVPFVLITDIFPFMRFGMFAEPVRSEIQTEHFIVSMVNEENEEREYTPAEIGFDPNAFLYLSRNYYYRNEAGVFLTKISRTYKGEPVKTWRFKRIVFPPGDMSRADTLLIKEYNPEGSDPGNTGFKDKSDHSTAFLNR